MQIAASCTAWTVAFEAKCRADKKEDKFNSDGSIVDLQVKNLFLSMCRQDALLKLRSLMSCKNHWTLLLKIRVVIQNYISPKERVITAERAKLLSSVQGDGETDDDFLAHLREEARYYDFQTLKTVKNHKDEMVNKVKF